MPETRNQGQDRGEVRLTANVDLLADNVLSKIRETQSGQPPETTPRRPDLRGIVLNGTGAAVSFMNPGGHSSEPEVIPPGQSFMIMFKGATLSEQTSNARDLFSHYGLTHGVTDSFLADLRSGAASRWIAECYGPAPFEKQSAQLTEVSWRDADGNQVDIRPEKGSGGAYGVRAPSMEEVYKIVLAPGIPSATLRGTDTNAENFTGGCYYMAVSTDWQTGAVKTKPIAPEVAKSFYGEHLVDIPVYQVTVDGAVARISRSNSTH